VAALLPPAELQFLDGNGHPYAAGKLATFVPGTTTPKNTWQDASATVLNANPITLDAAGRCIVYGDGEYRTQLSDAAGNLVWDQSSNTLVSVAMAPVVAAPTIADAVNLLGIQDMIDIETARAIAAENALQAQIGGQATTAALNAEIARAQAAEADLQNQLNTEVTRAEAAEANLQSQISGITGTDTTGQRSGTVTTNVNGRFNIAITPAYTLQMTGLTCWQTGTQLPKWPQPVNSSNVYNLDFRDSGGGPIFASVNGINGVLCLTNDGSGTDLAVVSTTINWQSSGI
jgi:hypothetical protein